MTGKGKRKKVPVKGFAERAMALGAEAAKVVDASTVTTAPWVPLRSQYGCGGYGSPPAVCRIRRRRHRRAG